MSVSSKICHGTYIWITIDETDEALTVSFIVLYSFVLIV